MSDERNPQAVGLSQDVILTHCGKLGDFLYSLQIASWFHRTTGRKVHWVLPTCFNPFNYLTPLLMLQPFTSRVTMTDRHRVQDYGCGGQPYRFDPRNWLNLSAYERANTPVYNLGFRGYPDKYVAAYYAEEYGLGYDPNFRLTLWEPPPADHPYDAFVAGRKTDEVLRSTEGAMAKLVPHATPMGTHEDLLALARRMYAAKEVHTWFCGLAILCYLANIPVIVHRVPGHAWIPLYYEGDYSKTVTFVEHRQEEVA